ncbi:hypothetical protein MACH18_20090 [Phaeobacter italicus]|uniref:Hint domain-containing protein n=1 Tax=Phaeobacter italicus TaxID=481446 RepID=UPI00274A5CC6|nr:Hint domain-containing protein [Phaeobacter italicus]GLO74929.1 hypothetical protein MACH18_20090 [Phaeobacter italicus]
MLTPLQNAAQITQTVAVFPATSFCVEMGANTGDPIGVIDDLALDDVYQLASGQRPKELRLTARADGQLLIAGNSDTGSAGAHLHLDCLITLMPDVGANVDGIVMVEVDNAGMIAAVYLLPLAPLEPQLGYTLVRKTRDGARRRLAQLACVSFTRGTQITLANGTLRPIEELQVGDRVLTRDDGAQRVRWIGQTTTRAIGDLAPVLIRAGVHGNERDLLLSPDHRLLVHNRRDLHRLGRADHLVRARDLVNGGDVTVQSGGFVDYFQLLFDRHHIIFAEGIAAESLLLDPLTRAALPDDHMAHSPGLLMGHQRVASGLDIRPVAVERSAQTSQLPSQLRRAMMR